MKAMEHKGFPFFVNEIARVYEIWNVEFCKRRCKSSANKGNSLDDDEIARTKKRRPCGRRGWIEGSRYGNT
jgi:hypothetical protein